MTEEKLRSKQWEHHTEHHAVVSQTLHIYPPISSILPIVVQIDFSCSRRNKKARTGRACMDNMSYLLTASSCLRGNTLFASSPMSQVSGLNSRFL